MAQPALLYFPTLNSPQLHQTLNEWRTQYPRCGVLCFVAESSRAIIPAIQTIFSETSTPLIGAMFPELLLDGEFKKSGALLMRMDEMPEHLIIDRLSSNDVTPEQVAQQLTTTFPSRAGEHSLFLLFDTMAPNIGTLLDVLFRYMADEFHFIGVNAGSETFQPMPCLFDATRLVGDALFAFLMPNHRGAILEHGYTMPQEMITATSTDNNRIAQIDWRPAFEVYAELVKKHYRTIITKHNFYKYGVHFPFGITRIDAQPLVRIPVALQDDGSLFCVGEIPENSLLTLLHAIEPGSRDTVNHLVTRMSNSHNDIMLGFYCAGRRMHLAEHATDELRYWHQRIAPRHLAGAMSLGEIGSAQQGGYPLFHNATLVYAPWIN
jgi:hypothetical protein